MTLCGSWLQSAIVLGMKLYLYERSLVYCHVLTFVGLYNDDLDEGPSNTISDFIIETVTIN